MIEAKSYLVFVLEKINDACTITAHAQRFVTFPIATCVTQASSEQMQQAARYDTTCHLGDAIEKVQKLGVEFEVLAKWLGFDGGENETWEPVGTEKDNFPRMFEDFVPTLGERNLKRQIIDL